MAESEPKRDWDTLIDELDSGSVRALTRLITLVENRENGWMKAMKRIYQESGGATVIGITGSPGTGKSTLTGCIIKRLADRGMPVGVIAVDPSSPFSGGAILADRIRMVSASASEKVFVRSMATRGMMGGLNRSARDVTKIMDAFGKKVIIIETVGVGQDEIEVVRAADLVVVVCIPGQGDAIQAIKAGLMEIADIFVVNKADLDGADQAARDIEGMLAMERRADRQSPPVLKTEASNNIGVAELADQALTMAETKACTIEWQEERTREDLIRLAGYELLNRLERHWERSGVLDRVVRQIVKMDQDPYTVVQDMLVSIESHLPKLLGD